MTQSLKKRPHSGPVRRPPRRSALPLALIALGVVALGVVGLAAWCSAAGAAARGGGTPSLKADKEKVDLGDVPLGQTVSVAFELTNTGDAPLRLKEPPYLVVAEGC